MKPVDDGRGSLPVIGDPAPNPRLALLNASYDNNYTLRNFHRAVAAELVEFDVTASEFPVAHEFDGVLVSGSPASVYDDEPWIAELLAWLNRSTASGLPHLGVCFGHQALATALGGSVAPMGKYEIGYHEIHRSGESVLLDGLGETFTAFTTHGDAVVDLPPEAEVIAENGYGVHGFQRGRVFGVQFHPEYDLETARSITRGKDLPQAQIDKVLAEATPEAYDRARGAARLFDSFTEAVLATQSVVRV